MFAFSRKKLFERKLSHQENKNKTSLKLDDGSNVAVVGGGPAGSFFSYFLLDFADRIGLAINVDIYEPRNFFSPGPTGCNSCGGIISESLVQNLAAEGINLPPEIIQRGIDSYIMHTEFGNVRIETPLHEKRIGAVHRGSGPKDVKDVKWGSFDGFLQILSIKKGASIIQEKVEDILFDNNLPQLKTKDSVSKYYDLVATSVGVNTGSLNVFQNFNIDYKPPLTTKTLIREYFMGYDNVAKYVGSSMHVFLLNLPRLEFAALIPKGDYVTLCMLGDNIDKSLLKSFLEIPEIKQCFPPEYNYEKGSCQCAPRISIKGADHPYGDRIVFVGDCGVNRLYKDGIGIAYRAAKSAATTAIFHGISSIDFKKHYWPFCKSIEMDNTIGKLVFAITSIIQKYLFTRLAVVRMILNEQTQKGKHRIMSTVMWDMFTGSAPYKEIFLRTFHPLFFIRFIWDMVVSILSFKFKKGFKE
jgi:flavin-dependent dehydrogenase